MKKLLIKSCLAIVFAAVCGTAALAQQTAVKEMSEFDRLVDLYFASLNETDAARRGELIRQVWTETGTFAYPGQEVTGHAAIGSDVAKVQKQYPGAIVRRTGKIEIVHRNYVRFTWEFGRPGGEPLIKGVDFAVISNGKLELVVGFFDEVKERPKN